MVDYTTVDFPILLIIDLLSALPPTSVPCEQSFSQLKSIKTSWRSKLSGSTLDNLMLVKMEAESIRTFDPEPQVESWEIAHITKRRQSYLRPGGKKLEQAVEEETEGAMDSDEICEEDTEMMEINRILGGEEDTESENEMDNYNLVGKFCNELN